MVGWIIPPEVTAPRMLLALREHHFSPGFLGLARCMLMENMGNLDEGLRCRIVLTHRLKRVRISGQNKK
jgi:hypothetical protein